MKRKVWFIMSMQDNVEDFSHDWGGEFYTEKMAAVCRAHELSECTNDAVFIVRMGEVSIPLKKGVK